MRQLIEFFHVMTSLHVIIRETTILDANCGWKVLEILEKDLKSVTACRSDQRWL